MHLFRAPNCTYYTRICLPKKLRVRGFPFVTLLMLYNGLRPSEACQLAIKDVKAVEGHMCLNITDAGDKQRTKLLQLFSYLLLIKTKTGVGSAASS